MGSIAEDTLDPERVREERDYNIRVRRDAIFALLAEVWHLQCPAAVINHAEAEQLQLVASRAVATTIPSREHQAQVRAEQVFAEVVDDAIRETMVRYDDDRAKLIIAAALDDLALALKRTAVVSAFAAYRGRLDGDR